MSPARRSSRGGAEEAAWQTAVEAAPYLVGPERELNAEELYEALKPFNDRVAAPDVVSCPVRRPASAAGEA
jgi:hypothetical protein